MEKVKNTFRIFILAVISIFFKSNFFGQVDIGADIMSRYVWRVELIQMVLQFNHICLMLQVDLKLAFGALVPMT